MPEHRWCVTVTARQQRLLVPSRVEVFAGKTLLAAICCVGGSQVQVQGSLKSDQGSPAPRKGANQENPGGHIDRWPDGRLSADAGLTGEGVLCALGIHGQWIYIHPEAELVIIRMGSEATPLNLDRVRGWRRGFDAIAEYFL